MFDRIVRQRKQYIKRATPITREQSRQLIKVFCVSSDTFIVKDYFGSCILAAELENSID